MVSENAKDNQPTLGHLPDTCLSNKHVTVTVGGCHTVKICQVWCTRNFRTSSSAVAISSHSHDSNDHRPAITDHQPWVPLCWDWGGASAFWHLK